MHDKEKEEKEILIKVSEAKPRFEIIEYSDFNHNRNKTEINNDCNILAIQIKDFKDDEGRARFYYDKAALKMEKLIYVEYILKILG